MKKAPFTISPRFLRLIAHHIFGDSPVTVMREMVQNAHDAVLMRAATDPAPPANWGVRIDVDEPKHQITVLDTGIGMGPQDIVESLTRLGSGAKEEEKIKALKNVHNPEMLKNVAGIFGFGFVAAMMVSKRVEIWSQAREGKPVYCKFDEGEEEGFYEEKKEQQTPPIGTRVVLHVDPDRARIADELLPSTKGGSLLNAETVAKILEKYCDLLEFEIMVSSRGEGAHAVNQMQAPWERGPRPSAKEMLGYFKRRFGEGLNAPLDYIVFNFTRQIHSIEASGVLFVPTPSPTSPKDEGKLEIFIKRIWVCDHDAGLLPEWAQFLKGVIVSPDLAVAIDRRNLDKLDKGYHDLRVALRDYLRSYFVELASKRVETYHAFLDHHGEQFRRGLLSELVQVAGSHPVWFTDLARTIPLRVYSRRHPTGHEMSLNELLDVEPTSPLMPRANGEKHLLHAVNRVVPPNQQSEFRRVIADKTHPIIVPESELDFYYLHVIGQEFEEFIRIVDVEYRFETEFTEPLQGAEQDRWQLFVGFISELLRYTEAEAGGIVNAGGISKTELPMLIHWRESRAGEREKEDQEPRARFHQVTTINTSNSFMQDLLKFVEERGIRRIESNSLVANCLHASYHLALLEQDARLRPKVFEDVVYQTVQTMKRSLASERELDVVKTARDQLQSELNKRVEEIERLKAAPKEEKPKPRIEIPRRPEPRMAAIVVVDLVGSTQALVSLDSADRPEVFGKYVDMLKKDVENHEGFFDKFTGDGVIALFGVQAENVRAGDACGKAKRFAEQAKIKTNNFGDMEGVRSKLQELVPGRPGVGVFTCRIAISYGKVGFGEFGGAGSAVGTKMVEAARICSHKELYPEGGGIVVTDDVWYHIGAPKNFVCFEANYTPRGLAHTVGLYRPG